MVITLKIDPLTAIKNPEDNKISFRYSDILSVPEWPEGPLIELIGGDLYMVPSPNVIHQRVSRRIESMIVDYLKKNPIGEVFDAPVDVVLSEKDVVVPDVFCILTENRDIIKKENIQGTPDFIIEILSIDKKKDLILKKKLYEHFHAKEYWVIDPDERSIIVYLYNGETTNFEKKKTYPSNSTVESTILPGFNLIVQDLFQDELET